ncbi:MaoC family dehydratase N-terminal domain-containing protein [Sedimentitalea sp.]|uniref:FAS1-like dehydratase domain-containing protein n=1 Tax=Sedimentitalea sp. TaxID=2048915 RepID=UPI0032974082
MKPDLFPDIGRLRKAIGRETTAVDILTPQQCSALCATLNGPDTDFSHGDVAPTSIHWCLGYPTPPTEALGQDGHPKRGDFLPAVPLPRRMWAGGRLKFHKDILVGDTVTRQSRVENVALKAGHSGDLCFVTVSHDIQTQRGLCIEEEQQIVYCKPQTHNREKKPTPTRAAENSRSIMANPTLLFRYSALTFNGHRIHYDRDYAINEEGYPGLVVQGPLQATFLVTLAAELHGSPKIFNFRSSAPLFDGAAFTVNAGPKEGGDLDLWVANDSGQRTMNAVATW